MEKVFNNQKGIIQLLIIGIVLLGIILGVYLVGQKTNLKSKAVLEGVDLSFQPNQISLTPNQQFTLNVFANTRENTVTAVEIILSFDPGQIEVKEIKKTDKLTYALQDGNISGNLAKITLGVSPDKPFKGAGIIATLTAVAKPSVSTTTIKFESQTKVAVLGKADNAIGTLTPAQISLSQSSASPTPTPTLIPSPSSSPSSSPSPSPSPTPSISPTSSPSPSPSSTWSPGPNPIFSPTPSPSSSPTSTWSPGPSPIVSAAPSPSPSPTQQVKKGDLNHDGVVNTIDASILKSYINKTSFPLETDINSDGKINAVDFAIIKTLMGK